MESTPRKTFKILWLTAICLPFWIGLYESSIWDSNEAFYVQTPREMLARQDWIVPHFNDVPRLNKPPLSYWLVGAVYSVFSPDLMWERSVLAAISCLAVLVVYLLGRSLYGSSAALLSAGIFATTFRFQVLTKRLLIDTLLLVCLLLALLAFISWFQSREPLKLGLFGALLGLAFLTKGPIALFPIPIVLIYLWWENSWQLINRRSALLFLSSFACVAASWFVLLYIRIGWEPIESFFFTENLGRYWDLDFGPQRGIFYYVGVFLGDFFPWSLLFLVTLAWSSGVVSVESSPQRSSPQRSSPQRLPNSRRLLMIWFLFFLLVFSFSQNKQEYYILPIYPVAALLLGKRLLGHFPDRISSIVTSLALLAAGLILWLLARQLFPATNYIWVPPLMLVAAGAALWNRRFHGLILGLSAFYATSFLIYLGPLEQYRPVRPLARILSTELEKPWPSPPLVGTYRLAAPSLVYYLNRPILELADPQETTRALTSERPFFLLLEAHHLEELEDLYNRPIEIVATQPKLYTTLRKFLEGFHFESFGRTQDRPTSPVHLVSNWKN